MGNYNCQLMFSFQILMRNQHYPQVRSITQSLLVKTLLLNGDLYNCWKFQQDMLIYNEVIKKKKKFLALYYLSYFQKSRERPMTVVGVYSWIHWTLINFILFNNYNNFYINFLLFKKHNKIYL